MRRLFFCLLLVLWLRPSITSAVIVSACDEANLRAAVTQGGIVTFACDGTIVLANTLSITTNVLIDGTGRNVTLSGANARRVLEVASGVNLTMIHITVVDGRTTNSSDWGAGLVNQGLCRLVECTFSNNAAAGPSSRGGAILHYSAASLEIDRCTFASNYASQGGGAIANNPFGVGSGPIAITNSTFYANSSNPSTISTGGALDLSTAYDFPVRIANCTFAANSSPALASSVTLTLRNTILSGPGTNVAPGSYKLIDGGHNISSDSSGKFIHPFSLNAFDPQVGMLADNGGPTPTLALLPGSPAIDSADNSICAATDQRGTPRPFGSYCDIGAYEATFASTHPGIIQLGGATNRVVEGSTNLVFTVARLGNLAATVSVQFATSNETAEAGSDYTPVNGTLVFAPGQRTNAIVVPVLSDSTVEDVETITVHLFNPSAGVLLGRTSAFGHIGDDDVGLSFSAREYQVSESNGVAAVSVRRIGNPATALEVQYSTAPITALPWLDYHETNGVITLLAGQTNATFTVQVRNDFISETNERVSLRLENPSAGAVVVEPSAATLSIIDDEPPPSAQFSTASYYAVEAAGAAFLTVFLTSAVDHDVAVNFETHAGSAIAGADFVSIGGTITFRSGESIKSVAIPLISDGPGEPDEVFSVSLSIPSGEPPPGAPATAAITVVDRSHSVGCDESALRAAVSSGGSISLTCDGTILLHSPLIVSNACLLDASGYQVTLSGGSNVNHFWVRPGTSLTLQRLTLTEGLAQGTNGFMTPGDLTTRGGPGQGGSIYNQGGVLRAVECNFLRNMARGGTGAVNFFSLPGGHGQGGALANDRGGQIFATNCVIAWNTAIGGVAGISQFGGPGGDGFGGAIFNSGGLVEAYNCLIATNLALSGLSTRNATTVDGSGSAFGGAIFNDGDLFLDSARVLGNLSTASYRSPAYGGAVHNQSGSMDLMRSSFLGNRANAGAGGRGRGGDAFGGGLSILNGVAHVRASTFSLNVAEGGEGGYAFTIRLPAGSGLGGAIFCSAQLNSINCSYAHNEAISGRAGPSFQNPIVGWARGGALFSQNGNVSLVHATVASNAVFAASGGDLGILEGGGLFSTNARLRVANSIIAYNVSGTNCYGEIVDAGKNLSSDASCDFTIGHGMINTDPVLGPLGDYGGPTPTIALLAGSPAMDAANSLDCPPTDQRGVPRPFGVACDIGAFESASPYSILGRISGYIQSPAGISVDAGASASAVAADGAYALHGFSPGSVIVTPNAQDAVFVLSNQVVNVVRDTVGVDFHSYRSNAFVLEQIHPDTNLITFAGEPGRQWRMLVSSNLVDWQASKTNIIEPHGLYEFLQPRSPAVPKKFLRAERLE